MPRKIKKNAAGAGTIRRRSDGRWEGRYTVGFDMKTGKQKQKSVYGKSQKEVREALTQITSELDTGSFIAPTAETLGQWLETWLTVYAQHTVKPYTFDNYMRNVNTHIKPALGQIKLSKLSAPQIQQFYNYLLVEKKLSAKSVKNIHGILHRSLQQAYKVGMIRTNQTEFCEIPRSVRKEIKPMDSNDIGVFLQAVKGHRYELIYLVTLFTGLRQGEVLGLSWDCVDYDRCTLFVNKQLQKTKKVGGEYVLTTTKNSRNRIIAVAPTVMEMLKRQQMLQHEMQIAAGVAWANKWNLVFTNELGEHLTHLTVYKDFKRIVSDIGMPNVRFHDLRHSYAVAAIESGDDIKTVQTNLGHATASFTLDVYGHVSMKMRVQSAERMEKFIQSLPASPI